MQSISPKWRSFSKKSLNRLKLTEVSLEGYTNRSLIAKLTLLIVHLAEIRKGLTDLRNGLKTIRQELGEYFADMDQSDRYGAQMWNFVGKANSRLEDLTDNVNLADTTFTEVLKYYGEEDKNVTSGEFYGIFKTFVTSYKVRSRGIHKFN